MSTEFTEQIGEIDLSCIEMQSRSDRLHPEEREEMGPDRDLSELPNYLDDLTEWEEFRLSVGTEPMVPVIVTETDDGYQLIDGHRRFRAVEQNGGKTIRCLVTDDPEDTDLLRVELNEQRKPNDAERRARLGASRCAPWLLPPAERPDPDQWMSQYTLAERVGVTQPTISGWIQEVSDENPVRSAVGEIAKQPGKSLTNDPDRVETIDEIVATLSPQITVGRELFVANELEQIDGVSLSELEAAAQKAEGWTDEEFLQYVDDHFGEDPDTDLGIESGMADGGDEPWEDTTDLGQTDNEPIGQEDEPEYEGVDIDVDWAEIIDESGIDASLGELQQKAMIVESFEDDGAIALQMLEHMTGLSQDEVVDQIITPLAVDRVKQMAQDE